LWLTVPNIPDASVPIGKTSQENKELYQRHPQNEDFSHACPHYELPNFERGLDFARGNKVTGAGFPFYVGSMAHLVRALIAFFLQSARENGYTELLPPLLVNAASATATGQLPDKEGQMYGTGDGFYLIPTAEVPVTNFFRSEIFDEADLPKKYCAYSACFRREAGSWGKDVRGLNRLHQFDKVELVQWVHPEKSFEALEALRKDAESLLQALKLPYRVLEICTGDLGFPHAKQYDLEVWAAGQRRWLEVSSCSCFTDFQARRADIRYRTREGSLRFVHTLNGSGLAVPRVLAALLENNHLGDGRIRVPSALKGWLSENEIQL
jgi:seryl-tRNA synthetase